MKIKKSHNKTAELTVFGSGLGFPPAGFRDFFADLLPESLFDYSFLLL
jgi:hypothetical protein